MGCSQTNVVGDRGTSAIMLGMVAPAAACSDVWALPGFLSWHWNVTHVHRLEEPTSWPSRHEYEYEYE
jgi:hypothetical protein